MKIRSFKEANKIIGAESNMMMNDAAPVKAGIEPYLCVIVKLGRALF